MRAAFSLLEFVIAFSIAGVIFGFSLPKINISLHTATLSLLAHIRYTQHLALNDSPYFASISQTTPLTNIHPSISQEKLLENKHFWQIQFHQSGIYTRHSYSIYIDTPRINLSTDRDGQPAPGDIVAMGGRNRRCLSGYSNVNSALECRNNTEISARLQEHYGVESIALESARECQETGTFRIYFDSFGVPYCTRSLKKLTTPLTIALYKNNQRKVICVLPLSGFSFISKSGVCE